MYSNTGHSVVVARICCFCAICFALITGCSRQHYRVATDKTVYGMLAEKSVARPWQVPEGFTILPNPLSRFFDPTIIEDPMLPMPSPQLYAYQLPPLPSQTTQQSGNSPTPMPSDDFGDADPEVSNERPARGGVRYHLQSGQVQQVSFLSASDEAALVRVAAEPVAEPSHPMNICDEEALRTPVIATANWDAVPRSSLRRMLEFDGVRDEYKLTFGSDPPDQLRDTSARLTLEDIVYLATINSREYQTQKETLYRAALELSLERYRYALKFSTSNNGVDVNYDHVTVDGISESSLATPAQLQVDKALITGGDFIARFANDVVFAFNGPQGFAADITSDALFQFSQSLLQRDIRFETLTQLERNVVYSARDYARYRKRLFVTLTEQYYNLIRSYREIDIAAQNYFQLVRAFAETEAEYYAGQTPRFQVDQVEQKLLLGRRLLVASTNSLENSLDTMKIQVGLPTETPLNLDLKELVQLTSRDDLAVTADLMRRIRDSRLVKERQKDPAQINKEVLYSASISLLDRMIYTHQLHTRLGEEQVDVRPLQTHVARLEVKKVRNTLHQARAELASEEGNTVTSEPRLLQATEYLNQTLGRLICRQLTLASMLNVDNDKVSALRQQLDEWGELENKMRADLDAMLLKREGGRTGEFLVRARQLQARVEKIAVAADRMVGEPEKPPTPEEEMAESLRDVDGLLEESGSMLKESAGGLVPVEIEVDDAMMTALVLRLDLMNERGALADDWRRIKLAADELRSVLNFSASQSISTNRLWNQPFNDFTVDTSNTQVRMSFDAPLNRRAQRNAYRRSLINYQVSLRGLMLAEDNIKLAVRQDLRDLALDKEQYSIDVASAALAFERTVSVRLEMRSPRTTVTARDFLEAQSAYVESLSTVAVRHISYIVNRMNLFFNTELLSVDERGFWNELYDEKYQPEPFFQLPDYATPAYGELPPHILYSKAIKRMNSVPTGISTVARPEDAPPPVDPNAEELPAYPEFRQPIGPSPRPRE